jgi:glycine cleavage system pyridoxal-binding protein P
LKVVVWIYIVESSIVWIYIVESSIVWIYIVESRSMYLLTGADWAVGHSGADRGPENFGGPEFTRFRMTTNHLSKKSPGGNQRYIFYSTSDSALSK